MVAVAVGRTPRLEWHPAIKALGWVFGWASVAVSAAIVTEFFIRGSEARWYPVHVGARALVIGAALVLAIPLLPLLELWWHAVRHLRREYAVQAIGRSIGIVTAIAVVIAGAYALLAIWLLRLMWRGLSSRAATIDPVVIGRPAEAGVGWTIVLLAGCALLAWYLVRFAGYFTLRNYAACIRRLGVRRVLRGVGMMVLLRLRQPRRDFFKMTPVIGDLVPFALCVVAYVFLPVSVFATAAVCLFAAVEVAMSLDRIRPPTWLYLGTSGFESFWVFKDLRQIFGLTAVCLLDRGGAEGYKFYAAEREAWSRDGGMPRGFFYDPGQPRMWNLRTRPKMWQHTVLLLIDFVPMVVVDVRRPSEFVMQEVQWLADPARIGKTLFLAGDEGLLPEYAAIIPESARDRVLTGEALYAYRGA